MGKDLDRGSSRNGLGVAVARTLAVCALGCTLLAVAALAARGADEERADIPACEELLSVRQAANAMGDPLGFVVDRAVYGRTRYCVYAGGRKGAGGGIRHSIGLFWGPFYDARKWLLSGEGNKLVCGADKEACRYLKQATTLPPTSEKTFLALGKALSRVGRATVSYPSAFDENPVIRWVPSASLAPMDQEAWVLVYTLGSYDLLAVSCTANAAEEPDMPCALVAARTVFNNVG